MSSDAVFDKAAAWSMLGHRLAEYRKAGGLTQESLAAHPLIHYGRSTIANVERGRQSIGRAFWEGCDAALGTGQVLTREYERITRSVSDQRLAAIAASQSTAASFGAGLKRIAWNRPELSPGRNGQQPMNTDMVGEADRYLIVPPGRALAGLAIPAQLHPAVLGEQVVTQVPDAYAEAPFLQRPGRALVVGQTAGPDPAAFVMDSRLARRRLRGAACGARLLIPRAYRLDELTFALLWAVANFDEALLADDAVIAASTRDTAGYELMDKSAASRDMAVDASPASRMWLGSQFCADHIRRHIPRLASVPVFWTREQRGEEAATWLLFAHKHNYLRDTSRAPDGGDAIVRVFCVPRDAVTGSPIGERALLLLAVALMESYGIHTAITDAPDLAATPGFVSDQRRRAITATWVGADGIWYVDVADDRATLRGYGDAAGYAVRHSVTAGSTPDRRLRAMADYLGLDWSWLVARCRELADPGTDGIAQPRSRLLSLAGVDRACQYIAENERQSN